jgi:hypothetical protein
VGGNRRYQPHARFFLYLERNPFAFWLSLVLLISLLLILASASKEGEGDMDTKVIFPVTGMTTKCPIHTEDAVKECHSVPKEIEDDVLNLLSPPGTYVIRIR